MSAHILSLLMASAAFAFEGNEDSGDQKDKVDNRQSMVVISIIVQLCIIVIVLGCCCLICYKKRKKNKEREIFDVDVNPVYDEAGDYGHDDDESKYYGIKKKKREEQEARVDVDPVYDGARWDYVNDEAADYGHGNDSSKKKKRRSEMLKQI